VLQIVIPAYNEEHRLVRTLRDLRRHVTRSREVWGAVEVIVVDNASTDDTARVAVELDSPALPIRVIRCEIRGKGAAVRAGVLASTADLVVFMDADGATHLDALGESVRLIAAGADVAVASRAAAGAVTSVRHSWARERGAQIYRSLTARVVPGIADTQCGFKVFRGAWAREVFSDLVTTGFSFDVELLALCQARGLRISEFPVQWTDVPGSTFHPTRHGVRSFADLAVITWRLRGLRSRRAHVVPLPVASAMAPALPTALGAAPTGEG